MQSLSQWDECLEVGTRREHSIEIVQNATFELDTVGALIKCGH